MKSKKLLSVILPSVLILFLFLVKDKTFALTCTPGECKACNTAGCCSNPPYITYDCGVLCGPCPQLTPFQAQWCCDATGGGWDMFCSCGGGCFTGETGIQLKTEDSKLETKEIKDLKPGDIVSSFDPETGEVKEGTVSDVTKTTREGYYILETESGKKVKVTGEHPFLAIKTTQQAIGNRQQELIENIKNVLSHTLTYKLITGLQAKVSGMLR